MNSYCHFCGNISDKHLGQFCEKCGYKLTPLSQETELINHIQIRCGRNERERQLVSSDVRFDGHNLYNYWMELYNGAQKGYLYILKALDGILIHNGLIEERYPKGQRLDAEFLPIDISAKITFAKTYWYDKLTPHGNTYYYESQRVGTLLLENLSHDERFAFLKWFLSTPPHCQNGELCFQIDTEKYGLSSNNTNQEFDLGVRVGLVWCGNSSSPEFPNYIPVDLKVGEKLTIGRNIQFTDRRISRKHATIKRESSDTYTIRDISSKNGTYVNEKRLLTDIPVALSDGDIVNFGRSCSYVWEEKQLTIDDILGNRQDFLIVESK